MKQNQDSSNHDSNKDCLVSTNDDQKISSGCIELKQDDSDSSYLNQIDSDTRIQGLKSKGLNFEVINQFKSAEQKDKNLQSPMTAP